MNLALRNVLKALDAYRQLVEVNKNIGNEYAMLLNIAYIICSAERHSDGIIKVKKGIKVAQELNMSQENRSALIKLSNSI